MKQKCKILSLDLWDTIIRRDCHPDEIKAMSAEYLLIKYREKFINPKISVYELVCERQKCEGELGNKLKQEGYDDEYKIKDVFRLWLKVLLGNSEEQIVDELYEVELKNELKHTYLDSGISQVIDNILFDKLICISDFYADETFLKKILTSIGFPYQFDKMYISCMCSYNKRSGRLFDYVSKIETYNFEDQIHIGDNKYSDTEIPQSKGIRTIWYVPEEENRKRKQKIYAPINVSTVTQDMFPELTQKRLSVFFYGFTSWIAEKCIEQKIEKIFFFTREGEYYKKLYDALKQNNPYSEKMPGAEILEVSRIATFAPSIRECTLKEMMRLWNQYSCQSMKAFFRSLDVSYDQVENFLKKYDIPWEKVLTYPWQIPEVQKLFEDTTFIKVMHDHFASRKELLVAYCEEHGLKNNGEKVAIVDIGWRGTIQDNISYIFPKNRFVGFYIGLIPFLNEQPSNVKKYGYINSFEGHDKILKLSTPFEMICNSPNGSTLGYEKKNEKIVAIRKKEKMEDSIYYNYTESVQRETEEDMKVLVKWAAHKYLLSWQIGQASFNALKEFTFYPDKKCADSYFDLKHNEEFGVGAYVDKHTRLRLDLLILGVFSKKYRYKLKEFLSNTTWPQGYLTKYHLKNCLRIYNKLLENERKMQ